MTMTGKTTFASLPDLPIEALQRSGAFCPWNELGRELRPVPVVSPGPVPALLPAPTEEVVTKTTWLYVTYPRVSCHPIFDDLVPDFDDIAVAMRASGPGPGKDGIADGLYAVRDAKAIQALGPMVCTVRSGPWTAVLTQTLDSCGRHGYLESHTLSVFGFPELTTSWYGPRENMPAIPNLLVIWGTASGSTTTVTSCSPQTPPIGGGGGGGPIP